MVINGISTLIFFPGWELAVLGVWEGGAGHGLLLCHLHHQLHGSELRQATAAAEALRGENQVMTRQKQYKHPSDCVSAAAERPPLSPSHSQLNNKPHPHPFSKRLNAQNKTRKRKTGTICWCVCFWGCMLLFSVRPSSDFVVLPFISLSRYA